MQYHNRMTACRQTPTGVAFLLAQLGLPEAIAEQQGLTPGMHPGYRG
jgi:hypothetical protein